MPVALDRSHWEWQTVDTAEKQQELRRLIAEWNKSGPNLLKLFKENPDLQKSCTQGTTNLIPDRDGVAQLAWLPLRSGRQASPQKDAALTLFAEFLVNPLSLKLGGPCARCGLFYLKNTPRQKTYCSRRCGTGNTAMSATKRKRQAEAAVKVLRAQLALERMQLKKPIPRNWKVRIAAKADVTEKWLTRALNQGKLSLPPGLWGSAIGDV